MDAYFNSPHAAAEAPRIDTAKLEKSFQKYAGNQDCIEVLHLFIDFILSYY